MSKLDKYSSLRGAIAAPLEGDVEPLLLFGEGMPEDLATRAVAETALSLELLMNTCVQIIVPTAFDVRNCKRMLSDLNLLYNTPLEMTNERPVVIVYSAENWLRLIVPHLGRSLKSFIFCIIEGSGYSHNVELIFHILVRSQQSNSRSRCLWFEGPVLGRYEAFVTGERINLPYYNTIAKNHVEEFSSPMEDTSKSLFAAITSHLDKIRQNQEILDCVLVLPSIELISQFRRFFLATQDAKYWSLIFPQSSCKLRQPRRSSTSFLNCVVPDNVYGNMFPSSNALIDSCLRRVTADSGDTKEYRHATVSEITDIGYRLSRENSYFIHCLCMEWVTWKNLKQFDETQRSKKQLGFSILELEELNIPSAKYLSQDDRYQKTVSYLLENRLLADSENEGEYTMTEIGKFCLQTRLSPPSTRVLDDVLFYHETRDTRDPRYFIFSPYIASIVSVWLDFRNSLFRSNITPRMIAKKSEFEFGDSLGSAILVYLNYVIDCAKPNFQGVASWCSNRGVRAAQLVLFSDAVSKLLHTLNGLYGRVIKTPTPKQMFSLIDDGPLETELNDLKELMFRIYQRKIWKSTGNGGYYRKNKAGVKEYWTIDPSIEPWITEHLESNATRFLALSKNKQTKTLSRLVF